MWESGIIISIMATGATTTYDLPYPVLTDPVNVHEDIQSDGMWYRQLPGDTYHTPMGN
jgi:hypothetical protein